MNSKEEIMIKPGICSITFRDKTPEEVIELCVATGLKGIEWGADVHVPPDDLENAKRVGELTRAAGLEVVGYGSYWFARDTEPEPEAFAPILEAALALRAPIVRIWGGSLTVDKTDAYFKTVVEQSRKAAELAAREGIKIAYEFHQNTYTETLEGALTLMEAVDHPNLYTFWQPPHGSGLEQRLNEIEAFTDRLLCVHVFHWEGAPKPPYPRLGLNEGIELWKPCLDAVAALPRDRFALLEFVRDNDVEQFKADALALCGMLLQSDSTK
jgi:3-dehydroshikimate dehydratase